MTAHQLRAIVLAIVEVGDRLEAAVLDAGHDPLPALLVRADAIIERAKEGLTDV